MERIKNYNDFLVTEKFDDNITAELNRLGVTDKKEIGEYLYNAHRGNLSKYLTEHGRVFNFGMLHALFLDAIEAKRKSDLKIGFIKMAHRILPMALAPFFPVVAIASYILGTSRAFNKVIMPILNDSPAEYSVFLQKIINGSMRIAEGEVKIKDRFTRAFVVSDDLVQAIKPEVLQTFSIQLSRKMAEMNPNERVPSNYIENEFKTFLNQKYNVNPKIPLKNE